MKDYKLGLYEKAMPEGMAFETMLIAAKQAGFDFLEISIDETDARLARLDWSADERAQLLEGMHKVGMQIKTMCLSGHRKYPLGSHDAKIRERGIEIFQKAVRLADELGIRIIQLAGYDVYYEQGDEDTRVLFEENLRACVQYAAQYAVNLGFETMETAFMDTVAKAMYYVNLVNSPYLGVYPDLGNLTNAAMVYGHDLYSDIESGHGHLFAMHLKETQPGQYRDMEFGTGHVDFSRGVEIARELGVRLFVSECWHNGTEEWEKRITSVRRFIDTKFA